MNSAEDELPAGRMYLLVIVCEAFAIFGLWLLGWVFA